MVGGGSTFTTGGTGNYNQSGGSSTTKVNGALTAGGGQVNINGGTLVGAAARLPAMSPSEPTVRCSPAMRREH